MVSIISTDTATPQAAEFLAFVTDEESRETLSRLVGDLAIPHAVVKLGNINDAIAHLKAAAHPPLQLVVDVSGSEMPLSDVNALAEVCEPSIHVIVIGERNDVGLFRDLMRLGVADYITKPLTATLLQRTLAFADHKPEPLHPSRSGKLVTVVGARGGVGATTIATNVAWQLAHRFSRRTVLADLDMQAGDVNMMLNLRSNQGLAEALHNAQKIDPVFLENTFVEHSPRLYVMTSEMALEDDAPIAERALEDAIVQLQHHFHYIICDVPLSARGTLWQLLEKSDINIIVADNSAISARNVLRLLKLTSAQATAQRTAIVINHIRPETDNGVPSREFESAVGRPIAHTIPYAGGELAVSENLGEVYHGHPPKFSRAIQAIVEDLMGLPPGEDDGDDWTSKLAKAASALPLVKGLSRVRT